MNTKRTLISALAVLFAVACGRATDLPLPPGEVAGSDLERELASAPSADLQQAVSGNTDFAFALYNRLGAGNDENLFFSPHSITLALSMTYAGSSNATSTAFETTLHQTLAQPKFHRAMNDLDRQLSSRGVGAKAADGKAFRLTLANQLFAQNGFQFEKPFLDTLAKEYASKVRLMDFQNKADPSRLAINQWVADRTEDRIKDLLAEGTVTSATRAVLVNAIYFNAAWKTAFEPRSTRAGTFHKADGSTSNVQMMVNGDVPARAATVRGVEVVELPYDGDEMSALLLMPAAGDLSHFEQSLSATTLADFVTALAPVHLDLTMPKFELRTSKTLAEPLKAMGLAVAFSDDADFTNMSKAAPLVISDVIHQAFVKVDEAGTEAAAATAVVVGTTSLPLTRTLVIDRPFVLLVRDNATGAIVFAGRIAAP